MTRAAHPDPRFATLGWFKSSYSSGRGGARAEVAAHPTALHIRDAKIADGPVLAAAPSSWTSLLRTAF